MLKKDKEMIQPITLSLIQKYSFTRKFKLPKEEAGDETADSENMSV